MLLKSSMKISKTVFIFIIVYMLTISFINVVDVYYLENYDLKFGIHGDFMFRTFIYFVFSIIACTGYFFSLIIIKYTPFKIHHCRSKTFATVLGIFSILSFYYFPNYIPGHLFWSSGNIDMIYKSFIVPFVSSLILVLLHSVFTSIFSSFKRIK